MTVYQKINGVWTEAQSIYIKRSGVHTPVTGAYVKRSGAWAPGFIYDVVPPDSPEIQASISDRIVSGRLLGRYVNLAVRGGSVHNPDIRRIRVLTTYNNAYPTSYLGGTYTSAPASNYPTEPWSEFYYNGYNGAPHANTSTFAYKRWPRNAPDNFIPKPGTVYHFMAWAEDFGGNWSAPVGTAVTIPSAVDAANRIYKQTRFQPTATGTATPTGFNEGSLLQSYDASNETFTTGMYFYGNDIPTTIGSQGTPHITLAQIGINRKNDNGAATANVYLFTHGYASPADVPSTGRVYSNITKLGTISKGEGKWFSIPTAIWPAMNTTVKGFGLFYKNPVFASGFAEDYSEINSIAEYNRSGEVVVNWYEGA